MFFYNIVEYTTSVKREQIELPFLLERRTCNFHYGFGDRSGDHINPRNGKNPKDT